MNISSTNEKKLPPEPDKSASGSAPDAPHATQQTLLLSQMLKQSLQQEERPLRVHTAVLYRGAYTAFKGVPTPFLQPGKDSFFGPISVPAPDTENKERNGFAYIVYPDETKYVGNFAHGQRQGEGTLFFRDGMEYKGAFDKDCCSGKGVLYYPNGYRYEGQFYGNKSHGDGVLYDKEGQLCYEGRWEDGQTREGIRYYSASSFCRGCWKSNALNGYCLFVSLEDHRVVQGNYVNNAANGGIMIYERDKRGGRYRMEYYVNGTIIDLTKFWTIVEDCNEAQP